MFPFGSIRRLERTRVFYDVDKTVFGSTSKPSFYSKVGTSSLSFALKSVNWSIFTEQTRDCSLSIEKNGVTNGFKPWVSEDATVVYPIQFLLTPDVKLFVAVHSTNKFDPRAL